MPVSGAKTVLLDGRTLGDSDFFSDPHTGIVRLNMPAGDHRVVLLPPDKTDGGPRMNIDFIKPRCRFWNRKPILASWILLCIGFCLWGGPTRGDLVSRKTVVSIMKRVCDWQLAHPVAINARAEDAWARSASTPA